MNQNTNNQQVSDDFLEWIDKVIKFSKEDIFVGGVCGDLQIKLMEQIRDKYASLNLSNASTSQLLCVGRRVKVDTEYYTVTSAMKLSDSILFNLQNSNGSLRFEIKK